jgi:hypothetical protein
VFPSDFGGYLLHPDSKSDQSSELKYGSEDMITRKQPQSDSNEYGLYGTKPFSATTGEPHHHSTTPLPDYEANATLTHDKTVDFFGDSITTERHGVSRSSLDQDSLHRGSISTLPSAGRNRRNSSHKRGVPISGTNNWSPNTDKSPQAKSAPAYVHVPSGDDALRNQNSSNKPPEGSVDSSSPAKEENRKSSIADMASAAVMAGSTAVAGVAAAASAALLGTTKPSYTETTEHQPMPSAWPNTPSQPETGTLDLSSRLSQHDDIEKKDATNCNYEPAIHGQSACFHTKDEICNENNKISCEQVKEPSLHGQDPSFYGCEGESHHADCVNRQAINNDQIIAQDFTGCHHKASPTDKDIAIGTNAICNSRFINAHNFDSEQHVGSTHDKIDYSESHGINSECITENDLTDPHSDFINSHPINQFSHGDNLATGFSGLHDSSGIDSSAITSNDMTQPKSHLTTGAAIGTASVLGAGAAIGAHHHQAINKGVLSAGNKSDISQRIESNPGSAGLEQEHQTTNNNFSPTGRALDNKYTSQTATPPPSASGVSNASSQVYGPSIKDTNYTAATSESNDISEAYRTDAQYINYDRNNINDVYRTDAQGAVQNMVTPENPITSTAVTNNDITDVYRTDAQGATQNMITAGNPTTNYAYNDINDVYRTTPRRGTPQSATPQYESTPRASGEVSAERDSAFDQDHSKGKGLLAGGGGIAAAVGGLLGKHHHQSQEKDSLNNEYEPADRTPVTKTNDSIGDKQLAGSKSSDHDRNINTMAAPAVANEINKTGQLHMDKLPLGNQVDQEPLNKAPLDNNAQPQQMHSKGTLAASNKPDNERGTSTESFSSTRAITGSIVPDTRGQDEVKDRQDNFKNVTDSTDTSFRNNQDQKQPQNSFFKTKAAAGTAAMASVFRRMSATGQSSGNKRNSIGKEHVRRLSDAEAFKNHTLANKDDGVTANKGDAGTTGFTTTAKNTLDKEDPGATNEHLKYTGVQRDYARIPGVYSLNTTGNTNSKLDPVNGENNFIKNEPKSPTKGGFFSGEHRRGSIQVCTIFKLHCRVMHVSQ